MGPQPLTRWGRLGRTNEGKGLSAARWHPAVSLGHTLPGASGSQGKALSTHVCLRLWGECSGLFGPSPPWGTCFSEAPRILFFTPTCLMECGRGEQSRLRPRLELFCKHVGFTKAPHPSCSRHPLPRCVSPYVPGQVCTVCPGCICNELIRTLFSNSPLMSNQPPKPVCFLSFEAGHRVLPEVNETP